MKVCSVCKEEKPLSEFNKNRAKADGHGDKCRLCMKEYRKQYYADNRKEVMSKVVMRKTSIREWMTNYKSSLVCSECGESHPATLDFHHHGKKDFQLSNVVQRGLSIAKIEKEIRKCVVLCSNCHRKLHWKENADVV